MKKEIIIKDWEKEFDEGCNTDNISDPPSDTEWIKQFIRNLLSQTRQEILKEVKGIGLTTKQSTKIFAEIEKDEEKFMKDIAYSAPEVIKERIKRFYWELYLRGRIDEKEEILKLFKQKAKEKFNL